MINKFQAFNLMRTSEYCEKKISGDFTTYKISICGVTIATVQKFKRGNNKGYESYAYWDSSSGAKGLSDNLMQAFAQVVESFMNTYNHVHRKDDYPALGRDLLNRCILRNGKFIPGDIIYLNDGDYGIVDSVLKDGYELLMNSSNKYHCVMSDGSGVTVFGSLDINHGLSVDWNKTFSKFYEDTLNEKKLKINIS